MVLNNLFVFAIFAMGEAFHFFGFGRTPELYSVYTNKTLCTQLSNAIFWEKGKKLRH
jgi:hypothetical protein